MDNKQKEPKTGQGFNDARGEIPDTEPTPKGNGQNVDNDPRRQAQKPKDQQNLKK